MHSDEISELHRNPLRALSIVIDSLLHVTLDKHSVNIVICCFQQEPTMPTVHLGSNRMGRQIREATSGLSASGMPASLQQTLSRDDSIDYSDDSPQGKKNFRPHFNDENAQTMVRFT